MAKRLTDTDIWKNQRWFRKLSPMDKLAFFYIKDQCHHSGVWRIDCTDLMEDLGFENFNLQNFIASVNTEYDKFSGDKILKERVVIINKTYLWITGFIQFQYQNKQGKVSADAAPVRSALEYLQGLGILKEGVDKGYIVLSQPLNSPLIRAKDKDKAIDKDKDKEKDKGVPGEKEPKKEETVEKIVEKHWFFKIYDDGFETYKQNFRQKAATEYHYDLWKEFIDFIQENEYTALFDTKFINPANFGKLVTKQNFTRDYWHEPLKKILATGVKPEHDLYFRIPEFITYIEKNGKQQNGKTSGSSSKFTSGAEALLAKGKELYAAAGGT
jgi:hypothetical protein